MAICIILLLTICHLANAEQCVPQLHLTVSQNALASRPLDQVTLTCALSGALAKDVESYLWLIQESNTPVYFYTATDPNNITRSVSSRQVLDEIQSISPHEMVSKLVLNVSVVDPNTYQCQFNLRGGQTCRETVEVIFKGPIVKIVMDRSEFRYGKSSSVANVTCDIDASAGRPHTTLRYIGQGSSIQILSEDDHVEDMGHYFVGTYHARLRVPTVGHILCEVTDDLGTYRATESIESVNCPDQIDLNINQDNLAQRPEDEVVLTCTLRGVPSSQLEYYWWLIDELNEPLYIFSETHGLDEITHRHSAKVVDETHTFAENTLMTKLRIRVNITTKSTYKCDFTLQDYTSCKRTTPIIFQDPPIRILFNNHPIASDDPSHKASQASLHEVNCTTNATIGEPTFEIGYTGEANSGFKIEMARTEVIQYGHYFGGVHRAIVWLPQTGQIDCKVSDMTAHFEAHKPIISRTVIETEILLEGKEAAKKHTVLFAVFGIIVPLILAATVVFIVRKYHLRIDKHGIHTAESKPLMEHTENVPFYISNTTKSSMRTIKDISGTPKLFENNRPELGDIQPGYDAEGDSWFLSVLYALCLGYEKRTKKFFDEIFRKSDINAKHITIRLWRREWTTVEIDPCFPTKDGHLCFVYSENKDVYWSTLLQKAYAKVCDASLYPREEWAIHALEDLTGGLAIRTPIGSYTKPEVERLLKIHLANGDPVISYWIKENTCPIFFCVTELLTADSTSPGVRICKFSGTNGDSNRTFEDFSLDDFRSSVGEIQILLNSDDWQAQTPIKGRWKHDAHDLQGVFWNSPKFVIDVPKWNGETAKEEVRFAFSLMQENKKNKATNEKLKPQIGIKWYQVIDDSFTVESPLSEIFNKVLESTEQSEPLCHRREICNVWAIKAGSKHILVPYIRDGSLSAEFLLRIYPCERGSQSIDIKEIKNVETPATTTASSSLNKAGMSFLYKIIKSGDHEAD